MFGNYCSCILIDYKVENKSRRKDEIKNAYHHRFNFNYYNDYISEPFVKRVGKNY